MFICSKNIYQNFLIISRCKLITFSIAVGENVTADILLPRHMQCAAHTLNLIAATDSEEALKKCATYKKVYRSAFGKAKELWNKQSRYAFVKLCRKWLH